MRAKRKPVLGLLFLFCFYFFGELTMTYSYFVAAFQAALVVTSWLRVDLGPQARRA